MALHSADVSAGDTATAAQYNNLRSDVQEHTHEGTDTTKVKAESLDVSTGNVPTDGVGTASVEDNAITADKIAHDLDATAIGFNADKVDGYQAEEIIFYCW